MFVTIIFLNYSLINTKYIFIIKLTFKHNLYGYLSFMEILIYIVNILSVIGRKKYAQKKLQNKD